MTREQFQALPEQTQHIMQQNHWEYKRIRATLTALQTLANASPAFMELAPFTYDDISTLYLKYKKQIADNSKSMNVCSNCLPLLRKTKARKNTRKADSALCDICNYANNWKSNNYQPIYRIRYHTPLAETRSWYIATYPELLL